MLLDHLDRSHSGMVTYEEFRHALRTREDVLATVPAPNTSASAPAAAPATPPQSSAHHPTHSSSTSPLTSGGQPSVPFAASSTPRPRTLSAAAAARSMVSPTRASNGSRAPASPTRNPSVSFTFDSDDEEEEEEAPASSHHQPPLSSPSSSPSYANSHTTTAKSLSPAAPSSSLPRESVDFSAGEVLLTDSNLVWRGRGASPEQEGTTFVSLPAAGPGVPASPSSRRRQREHLQSLNERIQTLERSVQQSRHEKQLLEEALRSQQADYEEDMERMTQLMRTVERKDDIIHALRTEAGSLKKELRERAQAAERTGSSSGLVGASEGSPDLGLMGPPSSFFTRSVSHMGIMPGDAGGGTVGGSHGASPLFLRSHSTGIAVGPANSAGRSSSITGGVGVDDGGRFSPGLGLRGDADTGASAAGSRLGSPLTVALPDGAGSTDEYDEPTFLRGDAVQVAPPQLSSQLSAQQHEPTHEPRRLQALRLELEEVTTELLLERQSHDDDLSALKLQASQREHELGAVRAQLAEAELTVTQLQAVVDAHSAALQDLQRLEAENQDLRDLLDEREDAENRRRNDSLISRGSTTSLGGAGGEVLADWLLPPPQQQQQQQQTSPASSPSSSTLVKLQLRVEELLEQQHGLEVELAEARALIADLEQCAARRAELAAELEARNAGLVQALDEQRAQDEGEAAVALLRAEAENAALQEVIEGLRHECTLLMELLGCAHAEGGGAAQSSAAVGAEGEVDGSISSGSSKSSDGPARPPSRTHAIRMQLLALQEELSFLRQHSTTEVPSNMLDSYWSMEFDFADFEETHDPFALSARTMREPKGKATGAGGDNADTDGALLLAPAAAAAPASGGASGELDSTMVWILCGSLPLAATALLTLSPSLAGALSTTAGQSLSLVQAVTPPGMLQHLPPASTLVLLEALVVGTVLIHRPQLESWSAAALRWLGEAPARVVTADWPLLGWVAAVSRR